METGQKVFYNGEFLGSPLHASLVEVVEVDYNGELKVKATSEEDAERLELNGGSFIQTIPAGYFEEVNSDGTLTEDQKTLVAEYEDRQAKTGEGDGNTLDADSLKAGDVVVITKISIPDLMQGIKAKSVVEIIAGVGEKMKEHEALNPEAVGEVNDSGYAIGVTTTGQPVLVGNENAPQKLAEEV